MSVRWHFPDSADELSHLFNFDPQQERVVWIRPRRWFSHQSPRALNTICPALSESFIMSALMGNSFSRGFSLIRYIYNELGSKRWDVTDLTGDSKRYSSTETAEMEDDCLNCSSAPLHTQQVCFWGLNEVQRRHRWVNDVSRLCLWTEVSLWWHNFSFYCEETCPDHKTPDFRLEFGSTVQSVF